MNAVEIEEAVSALTAEPFDQAEFPFAHRSLNISAFGGDMRGHAGLTQVSDEPGGVISLVCPKGQLTGRSWRMAVDHVQRGTPFGMAIRFGLLLVSWTRQ